ncbi:multiple sugar transport system substrate-binding protein [Micromonospora echinospora]|uniref:Multiple sugar transport system substrate-binding protein n=1 Tax=Micromonospora echinospora TaxID=1877 RepID=A0A1C4XHX4_MICEC|nr:extracellular solute-binding protein [Micromonospora echinospora]SCF08119.1 multiple sugar transport system substrate-binding protein [Micromonospora echinospora]
MSAVPYPTARRTGADPGRRRVLAGLFGLPVVAAGGLTGCRSEPAALVESGPVELSVFWWGSARRAQLTEQALRLYSDRNPQVTFRVTWQGLDGYYQRLATQAVGGNVPDLFQIDDTFLTEYARRDILLDLTGYAADHRLDLSGLPDGLVRYGQVAGRTMAVAAAQNSAGLVFNRDLLARLRQPAPRSGMSYPEYLTWAARVTDASDGRVAGTMDPSGDHRALWLWLRSRGKEFYQGRKLGFDSPELIDWFELWQRARTARATPSAALVQQANGGEPARQLVVTGHTAASFAWSNQLVELQRHSRDELGIVSCPGPAAAQWARASMYWAGFRGTRHPDVVADVINFLTTNVAAGRVLGYDRGLSPHLNIRKFVEPTIRDASVRASAAFELSVADTFGTAPPPPPTGHARIRELLITTAESVQAGRSTIRAAAWRFMAQAAAALAA